MVEERKKLSKQLKELIVSVNPKDRESTLSTLKTIFNNIIQYPNDDKYRQIKLTSKTLINKVWQYPAGEELMKISGWVVEDDHVRIRDESHVHIVLELLEEELKTSSASPTLCSPRKSESRGDTNPSECHKVPAIVEEIMLAISDGNGTYLRYLLKHYDMGMVKNKQFGTVNILTTVFMCRQIGIARILVNEYGVDVHDHVLGEGSEPCFLKLFETGESTKCCQSLIIQFIKEFKLDVNSNVNIAALHYAVLNKLFTVVRFLVEECKVNVNCKSSVLLNATPLHLAYGIGEESIAQYLIKHGAGQDALDEDGRKPVDYELLINSKHVYLRLSKELRKLRAIEKSIGKPESFYYAELLDKGISRWKAIELTFEKFPSLQKVVDDDLVNPNLETTPTMRELSHYVTEMAPSYYEIGLELDIVNSKLKVIQSNHLSLPGLEDKCLKMLDVWLENNASATWKKLCDALQQVKMGYLAEQIKNSP